MSKKDKLFIGIDVSKATLDVSIGGKHLKIKNNSKVISDFIKTEITLPKMKIGLVCLESTGGYERVAMQCFHEASIAIHRAHPNKIHAFAKVSGHFAKTDKLDAKLLEKYAAFISDHERGDIAISKAVLELQELRAAERNLMDNLHAVKCRMQHSRGKATGYLEKQIIFINEQLKGIRQDISEVIKSDDELTKKRDLLKSYKGVGDQISSGLLAELPELGNLNNKQVASLVGVAPKLRHSGVRNPGGHIFGGRFYVRKSIYMAALVAIRYNKKMQSFYQRLISAGKAKKLALTAVMRKIIVCLNSMVKYNNLYII